MSSIRSRAAIRFVVALFLAQTFVNAVAVPHAHPHIHKVLDPRQVVSLQFVERQEPAEPESRNVFDAIVDTLRSYNGWQIFQDFFRKLFNNPPPAEDDDDTGDNATSTIVFPTPDASETPVDIVSIIESIINEVVTATEPVVVVPSPTDAPESSATDGIMSILPIFPITTAIELFPTGEPAIPTELISELSPETTEAPESTDVPVVVVVPPFVANSTDVGVALPTGISLPVDTAPIVTGPVEVAASATAIPIFPIDNGTVLAPLPGTDVPVVVILPTGISSPIEANVSASAEVNATVSLTSTIDLTITVEPTLIGTNVPSVGTGLPITFTEEGLYANATAITPTLVLVTGTADAVETIVPTLAVEPIDAPYVNASDATTTAAPIGTGIVVLGTGVQVGTIVTSIEPVETIILGTGIVGTGTGEAIAVAPVETALPLFANTTAVEIVVEPTFVLGTGTAPAGTISAAPIATEVSDVVYANTTTTTITNTITPSLVLATGVETAVAPAGTIVIVPGPDSTDLVFPNVTIVVNSSTDATLSIPIPIITDLPVENVTVVSPILDPIPSDAPVVEFPGEPTTTFFVPVPALTLDALPSVADTASASVAATIAPVLPIIPIPTVDASVAAGVSILPAFDVAPAVATASAVAVPVPVVPVPSVEAVPAVPAISVDVPAIPAVDVPAIPAVDVPAIPAVDALVAPAATDVPVVPTAPIIPTLPIAPLTPPVGPAIQPAILPAVGLPTQ